MIHKHEIPILEFDDNPQAVIMPTHEDLGLDLPARCVYGFLEEEVERYAISVGAEKVGEFVSATKTYPVYVMNYNGKEICLAQAPVGSAAAAQFMDWLIGYGVKQIISTGTCGVLVDIPENVFLIPTRALRDEGASYHYVAPSRYIDMNKQALEAIEKTLKQKKIPYEEVWNVLHLQQLLNFEELFGDYYYLRQIPLQILTITIKEIGAQRLLIRLWSFVWISLFRCNLDSIEKKHDCLVMLFSCINYYFKISQSSWGVSVTKYGFSANRVSLAPNPQVTAIVLMPTVFPPIKSNLVSPTMTDWALGA